MKLMHLGLLMPACWQINAFQL